MDKHSGQWIIGDLKRMEKLFGDPKNLDFTNKTQDEVISEMWRNIVQMQEDISPTMSEELREAMELGGAFENLEEQNPRTSPTQEDEHSAKEMVERAMKNMDFDLPDFKEIDDASPHLKAARDSFRKDRNFGLDEDRDDDGAEDSKFDDYEEIPQRPQRRR